MNRKKRKKPPVETVITPMNYKRLFAFLHALTEVRHRNFESELGLLLRGLYYEDGGEWFDEGKRCEKAAFLTSGFAYGHYHERTMGKVVFKIFKPGELIVNADVFFNGVRSNFSASLCPEANLMYITQDDLRSLVCNFSGVQELVIKTVSALHRDVLEREEMLRMQGKKRIIQFFKIYPDLLKSARQGPMTYQDIASYLQMTPFNFSILMKALFPHLSAEIEAPSA